MPAIRPAQLKIRVTDLVENFDSPKVFISGLNDLLDYYSDRTRKPGRGGGKLSLLRAYNVSKQVTKQIESILKKKLITNTELALVIADLLWDENWLECRILALTILGWLSPNPPKMIIKRLESWSHESGGDQILDASFSSGLSRLWLDSPEDAFSLLESWLTSTDRATRKLGLRVLPPLVSDPSFTNIPRIFRLVAPYIQKVSLAPDSDVLNVVRVLAQHNPQETAYFLRRNLALSENPGIYALIRQSLDAFSSPTRQSLVTFLHERRDTFDRYQ